MIDYLFHSKYIVRHIIMQNCYLNFNTINLPFLNYCVFFFNVYNIQDFDDICSSNYFYFLKFFFGKKAYLVGYLNKFQLNIIYHSFSIQLKLDKMTLFNSIYFIVHDILPFLNQKYFRVFFFDNGDIECRIYDMNLFTEKKTNLGFFNLRHNLYFRFNFSGVGFVEDNEIILGNFKLLV